MGMNEFNKFNEDEKKKLADAKADAKASSDKAMEEYKEFKTKFSGIEAKVIRPGFRNLIKGTGNPQSGRILTDVEMAKDPNINKFNEGVACVMKIGKTDTQVAVEGNHYSKKIIVHVMTAKGRKNKEYEPDTFTEDVLADAVLDIFKELGK